MDIVELCKVVARCQKCGRGFVTMPEGHVTDVYPDQRAWTSASKLERETLGPCGGTIVPITAQA